MIQYKLIFHLRKDYFKKLVEISRTISEFNHNKGSHLYELDIKADYEVMLKNYQPLPTNRKKRSRLYNVRKNKVLRKMSDEDVNVNIQNEGGNNSKRLKNLLKVKNLA